MELTCASGGACLRLGLPLLIIMPPLCSCTFEASDGAGLPVPYVREARSGRVLARLDRVACGASLEYARAARGIAGSLRAGGLDNKRCGHCNEVKRFHLPCLLVCSIERSGESHCLAGRSATTIATTASAITPVASQPRFLKRRLTVKRPMISGRTAISIITAMIGTEITPLITALQMSALTGSISVKLSATPIVVAAMRMP